MVQLAAVEAQNPCRFFRVNLKLHASSRFTTISMERTDKQIKASNFSLESMPQMTFKLEHRQYSHYSYSQNG